MIFMTLELQYSQYGWVSTAAVTSLHEFRGNESTGFKLVPETSPLRLDFTRLHFEHQEHSTPHSSDLHTSGT